MGSSDFATGGVRFAGYASIFDKLDRGGDVVRPGAFKDSLKLAPSVPLLWQHQSGKVVGTIERLQEDGRGLQVIGRLKDNELGRLLGRELRRGALTGLSFGYRVEAAQHRGRYREIARVELLEVSLVRHPMQPLARIHKIAA